MTVTAMDTYQSAALAIRPGQEMWTDKQRAALAVLGIRDASSADLAVFMHVSQRTGLDPFSKQIYMIARRVKENGQWIDKWTIQTGIDGFRVIRDRVAARQGVTVEYEDTIWYDREGHEHKVWLSEDEPAGCVVTVIKDGRRYPGALRFNSYAARHRDTGELTGQWKNMPDHMIEKCFHGSMRVETDRGSLFIRDIVNKRLPVKVRSIDLATGLECWQPVVNWWRNGLTSDWVRIWAPTGRRGNKPLRVTPNHHIWTPVGWRDAGDLMPGDPVAVPTPALSAEQEQVILGGLLGDGSLGGRKRPSSLPYYTEAHSAAQADYLTWKAQALASLGVSRWKRLQSDGGGGRHETEWMRTRALPSLYRYRGMKPGDLLAGLGDLGFAVWFMDDGGFTRNGHGSPGIASAIHCCGFSVEFADAAVVWLAKRYGISAKVLRRGRNPYIAISSEGTRHLETVLAPWVRRDDTRKHWTGDTIQQGHDGFAFVPVLAVEHLTKNEREQRYDIEVAETHTLVAGGIVASNCCEAFALRRAFPHDLGGVQLEDEMPQQEPGAPAVIRQRGRVTVAEVINNEPAADGNGNGQVQDVTPAAGPVPSASADETVSVGIVVEEELSDEPGSADPGQIGRLRSIYNNLEFKRADQDQVISTTEQVIGRDLDGPNEGRVHANLSAREARSLIGTLEGFDTRDDLIAFLVARETEGRGEMG